MILVKELAYDFLNVNIITNKTHVFGLSQNKFTMYTDTEDCGRA